MIEERMQTKLADVEERHAELNERLCDPTLAGRRDEYLRVTREHAEVSELVAAWKTYKKRAGERDDAREFFTRLTSLYKNWNYSPAGSEDYRRYKEEIATLTQRHEGRPERRSADREPEY